MSKSNNKKILLGSALAGLMMAAPGISVTTSSSNNTGSFFQTAELSVGYKVAQAEHHEGEKKEADHKCGAGKCGKEMKDHQCEKDGKDGKCDCDKEKKEEKSEATKENEKKADDAKATKESTKKAAGGSCGAGSCGK